MNYSALYDTASSERPRVCDKTSKPTKGLPKKVDSLCPECTDVISAEIYEENGKVMMKKSCPHHGEFLDLYWSDVELYLKAEDWFFGDGIGFEDPKIGRWSDCPKRCGPCELHASTTCLGNIDLTNRCNLTCPVCFANASVSGRVYEPPYDDVVKMLQAFRDQKPIPCVAVQFSGGEPTLHPDFLRIIRRSREMGFTHIQIASNGLKLNDLDFCVRCADAGLHTVYLQFDGTSDETYRKTRGRPLMGKKVEAIENVKKTGMKVVLVPTIINGVNDHEVGNILKFTIENADVISGISYQPVAFTGRISTEERLKMRFTLPDLARCVEEQTGLVEKRDWYPLSCITPLTKLLSVLTGDNMPSTTCHPHCSLGTFVYVNRRDRSCIPITRFVDIEGLLRDMNRKADQTGGARIRFLTKTKAFMSFKKYFKHKLAPEGLSFDDFLVSLEGLLDKDVGRSEEAEDYPVKVIFVAGMHFLDSYNYEVERVRRCVIHYATPEGNMYPFCTYNSGPRFRDTVEQRLSRPLQASS